jgi:hypothetical protein
MSSRRGNSGAIADNETGDGRISRRPDKGIADGTPKETRHDTVHQRRPRDTERRLSTANQSPRVMASRSKGQSQNSSRARGATHVTLIHTPSTPSRLAAQVCYPRARVSPSGSDDPSPPWAALLSYAVLCVPSSGDGSRVFAVKVVVVERRDFDGREEGGPLEYKRRGPPPSSRPCPSVS